MRRGLLNKPFLALAGCLVALLVVAALPAARQLAAFRPGELTPVHAGRIEASACFECHTPFLGVADARCQECHGPGRPDEAPLHHPEAAESRRAGQNPRCTACHLEHLGTDGLTTAGDRRCLECHRDLERVSAAPRFARTVTSFAGDHPELALTVVEGGATSRVSVTDPALRRADPTAVRMDHAKHLAPGLVTPEGRQTLTCQRCHRPATGEDGLPTGLAPIRFDTVCVDCHALTFDDRYPDETAPHVAPEELRGALYVIYHDREMTYATPRQRRLDALRDIERRQFDQSLLQEAIAAENRLYQKCAQCHRMDLESTPYPAVEPPRIPERWFPHARFDHSDHRIEGLQCSHCHAGARSSETSADLLLPGIASCTPCHGGAGAASAAEDAPPFPVVPAPDGCGTCHGYHSGVEFPAGPLVQRAEAGGLPSSPSDRAPGGAETDRGGL